MEKSFIFNGAYYKAEDFREYFATFISNGVFPNPSTQCQVTANNNMAITIKPGKAWINGAIYVNTDDYILNIDVADGVINRIDRVVLRFDTVKRAINAYIKKGQFASSPVAPTLERNADMYELALADIRANAGAISIVQSDITDLRLDKNLCGIVHGTVDQVDTTTIFNQYLDWYKKKQKEYDADFINWNNDERAKFAIAKQQFEKDFNDWFDGIKNALNGDVAGNLLNKIYEIPKIFEGKEEPQDIRTGDFWLKEV